MIKAGIKTKYMKKSFLIIVLLVIGLHMDAQQHKKCGPSKYQLYAHYGLSLPVGSFSKPDPLADGKAGMANPGYSLNMTGMYVLQNQLGVAATVFYAYNRVDNSAFKGREGDPEMDHWQMVGLTGGLVFMLSPVEKIQTSLKFMTGLANVNMPKTMKYGQIVVKEDWSLGAVVQGGIDFKYAFVPKVFVFAGADYMYTKPTFSVKSTDGTVSLEAVQPISLLNLSAGIGLGF
jgi:hypothetical protein